jgi:hypothetical protein
MVTGEGEGRTFVKDRHYIVGWSLADTPKIERYTERMRSLYGKPECEAEYTRLADLMINLIQKRHDDHHSATAELGHDWLKVEPINNPSFEEDMVTFQGLNKLLKIYIGTASGVFKWTGRSTASATPTPYTTALTTEIGTRQDSTVAGFHNVIGSSIRIFSAYGTSATGGTIYQIGVFDAITTGLMLAIHDFGAANGYTHVINVDSFSLGMVIDFIPFGDV